MILIITIILTVFIVRYATSLPHGEQINVKFAKEHAIFQDSWGNAAGGEELQPPSCMKPWYSTVYLTVSLVVQPVPISRLSSNSWSIHVTNPAGGGGGGGGGGGRGGG